jgi:hypothetical protein
MGQSEDFPESFMSKYQIRASRYVPVVIIDDYCLLRIKQSWGKGKGKITLILSQGQI